MPCLPVHSDCPSSHTLRGAALQARVVPRWNLEAPSAVKHQQADTQGPRSTAHLVQVGADSSLAGLRARVDGCTTPQVLVSCVSVLLVTSLTAPPDVPQTVMHVFGVGSLLSPPMRLSSLRAAQHGLGRGQCCQGCLPGVSVEYLSDVHTRSHKKLGSLPASSLLRHDQCERPSQAVPSRPGCSALHLHQTADSEARKGQELAWVPAASPASCLRAWGHQ